MFIHSLKTKLLALLIFWGGFAFASDSLMVYTLEDVSIIDFKTDHKEVFKNIDIELKSISLEVSSSLEEALQNSMPVYFKNYSHGGVSYIDFRGTGAERTQVYWNGIPINSPTLGGFDFSLLPAFFISEAKVRFGGASIVDGGGGIGGSIQLNQNSNFEKKNLELIGSFGSFGNYSAGFKGQFIIDKLRSDTRLIFSEGENNFSFKNTSKKDHPEEERTNNQVKQLAFQQSFNYAFSESKSLDVNLLYSDLDRNIPSTISAAESFSQQHDQLFFSQLGYNHLFKNEMYFKFRTSFQRQVNDFKDDFVMAHNVVNGWNNKLDWGDSFGRRVDLNASIRYDYYQVNTQGTGEIEEHQFSALLASDIRILAFLSSSIGFRIESRNNDFSPAMPFIGLDWSLPNHAGTLRGNVSRVFRFPTINERYWQPGGNKDLKTEEGWNYELAYLIKREKDAFSFDFQMTAFYSLVNDWILWYPSENSTSFWEAQNLWKVNSSGLEIITGSKYAINKDSFISLRFSYTLNDSHVLSDVNNDGDLDGKQLILVPRHMVFVPLLYQHGSFSSGLNYRYTSERYSDRLNENVLDAYHLLDWVIAYQFFERQLEAKFKVNNILDQNYETYPGQPLPGINFNFQLKWRIF